MAKLPEAFRAFGLDTTESLPVTLDGGQGTSFLVGNAVFKPVENGDELDYILEPQERLIERDNHEYRVPQPLVALASSRYQSRYIIDGWGNQVHCRHGHCHTTAMATDARRLARLPRRSPPLGRGTAQALWRDAHIAGRGQIGWSGMRAKLAFSLWRGITCCPALGHRFNAYYSFGSH
jgi:hypothetical protein